jgi:hypothetical protein
MNLEPRNHCSRCGRVHFTGMTLCAHCEAADRRKASIEAERQQGREWNSKIKAEGAFRFRTKKRGRWICFCAAGFRPVEGWALRVGKARAKPAKVQERPAAYDPRVANPGASCAGAVVSRDTSRARRAFRRSPISRACNVALGAAPAKKGK